MSELKYYKHSGKINIKTYLICFFIAIIVSYYIGQFYNYFNGQYYQFIIEKVFKSYIDTPSNKFSIVFAKLLSHPKGTIILCILTVILLLPFFTTLILMCGVIIPIKVVSQSRNKIVDLITFIPLSLICFFVGNKYIISTTLDYIELSLFLIFAFFASNDTNYFCEKCTETYEETEFYLISDYNSDMSLQDLIKNGIDKEIKYKKKEILEKDDVLNFSFVKLNKCETCGSQIVKIESKIIEVDSDGKKKIKDGKKITEHLIIS